MATGPFGLWVVMVQSCQQMVRLIMALPGASSWEPLVGGPGRRETLKLCANMLLRAF